MIITTYIIDKALIHLMDVLLNRRFILQKKQKKKKTFFQLQTILTLNTTRGVNCENKQTFLFCFGLNFLE